MVDAALAVGVEFLGYHFGRLERAVPEKPKETQGRAVRSRPNAIKVSACEPFTQTPD
jgi:hypothetical protein